MWKEMEVGGGSGDQWDVFCTLDETSQKSFTLGFEPKKLIVAFGYTNAAVAVCEYDKDTSTTQYSRWYQGTKDTPTIGNGVVGIQSITNNGFQIYSGSNNPKFVFYAAQK